MILREFPDIAWLKKQINTNFNNRRSWDDRPLPSPGWPSVILNVKTRAAERLDIRGPFSIFMNLNGWSNVKADHKEIRINENAYVLTNQGQCYDLVINEPTCTETLNIHFGEKFYKEALYELNNTHEHLLNYPVGEPETNCVPIKSFFRDPAFNQLIKKVTAGQASDELVHEQSLFELFVHVFRQYQKDNAKIDNLKLLKKTAREEILRRLLIARDYIHVFYSRPISLQDLAEASCLSKFHFLRLFKEAFHISPYQYLKKIRLQQAVFLIGKNKYNLSEIALMVGLENGSSLSRMIHRSTGIYPSGLFKQEN